MEEQMEEKARLIKQKNELTNLMKTVENNIEPKRFKTMMGSGSSLTDELLDFDHIPDVSNIHGKGL